MHMARRFFFAAMGLFLLSLSYYFGASRATAQVSPSSVVAMSWQPGMLGYNFCVVTASGNVYASTYGNSWNLLGNVFGGAPTPAIHESWGQVKERYR